MQAASEYSGIAVGNITTAIDQLRTAQRTLQSDEAALQQQQQRDRSDQAREAAVPRSGQRHRAPVGGFTGPGDRAAGRRPWPTRRPPRPAAAAAAVAAARRSASSSSGSGPAPTRTRATRTCASTAHRHRPHHSRGWTSGGGTPGLTDPALNPFLQCVVQAESGGNYGAVSPNGLYMGAFQFSQSTWNFAAQAAGLPSLVGVPPNLATKAEQDTVAVALYALDGEQPWLGDRCSSLRPRS